MDKEINRLDLSIFETFGQFLSLTFSDGSSLYTRAIINTEVVQFGKYDAIQGEITVLHISSSIPLKRGVTITDANAVTYEVDRKLKDDGHLAKWNIYADR